MLILHLDLIQTQQPSRRQYSLLQASLPPFLILHPIATMQTIQLLLATLFAASAVIAAPVASKSMMASGSEWTIESMKRVCNTNDTSCTWTFGINTGSGAATNCTLVVAATDASEANGGPATCGAFTVTSGWSGQFGQGNGFTTLAVVDNTNREIIWPAYTDVQLADGQVVTPDQSYAPAALP